MTFPIGHHPGAEWHKADLQCHSPRDWHWVPRNGDPQYLSDADRKHWAEEFVDACLAKGLRAVAITDHHDFCMVGYVREHVEARQNCELKVFAGIEITCDDGVQCLAIFDGSSTKEDWGRLLSKLRNVQTSPPDQEKTCAIGPCGHQIRDLFPLVMDDARLKEVCILIPHFGNPNAHKSLNKEGHHSRFVELDCDGLYFETPYTDLEESTLKKARGEISEWGSRRRAMIATGDNRTATWDRLGAHHCWIKIGEFSTEALRQAFLADTARITHVAPSLPSERIVSLKVLSTLTGSDPVSITFNAGYTALIGGRGSGKSALLEYMRFALGRADQDFPSAGLLDRPKRGREAELLDATLSEGFVEITIEREGTREIWTRMGVSRDKIKVKMEGRDPELITPESAQRRFRARGFTQKELSTTMNDPATAADQITGIVAAEALDQRRRVEQDIANAQRNVSTALQKIAAHWQAEFEKAQADAAVRDLEFRILSSKQRMEGIGVKAENLTILGQAPIYGRTGNQLAQARAKVAHDTQAIQKLKDSLLRIEFEAVTEIPELPFTAEVVEAIKGTKEQVDEHLNAASRLVSALAEALEGFNRSFEAANTPFKEKLDQAANEQQAHKTLLEDLKRLNSELTEAEAVRSAAAQKTLETQGYIEDFENAVGESDGLVEKKRDILSVAARLVEEKSANLRARLKKDKDDLREYVAALSALFEGTGVRDVPDKCRDRAVAVARNDGGWKRVRDKLVEIYREKIRQGKPQEPSREFLQEVKNFCFDGNSPVTEGQATKILSRLDDQIVGKVLAAIPHDGISLTYVDESGRRFSFNKASPGQQASALLQLLLQQEAGTLVIDQPEDDLDNRVIMRIVEKVKTSKNSRQLIFTTHNPNLVVNGDADKVVVMRSAPSGETDEGGPKIEVEVDGAIETLAVCTAITTVMEGGKEAFDLRSRKYQFDNSRS